MNSASSPRVILVDEIKDMIPHRDPFLFLDRVEDVVVGQRATGIKEISVNEPFFAGHFPGHPIMPGVLIVEAMAQASAVLVMESLGKEARGKLVYFMSVEEARFRKPVLPGCTLQLHVQLIKNRSNIWKFSGEARVGENLVADAVFTAMMVDR